MNVVRFQLATRLTPEEIEMVRAKTIQIVLFGVVNLSVWQVAQGQTVASFKEGLTVPQLSCKDATLLPEGNEGGKSMPRRITALAMTPTEVQELVKAAVAMGANPEQAREHFKGHSATDPLTRFLLARVNPWNKDESDLGLAVSLDLAEIAADKLNQGADPNVCTMDGITPLMDAAMNRNHRLVALLLNSGAQVNVRSKSGATPLRFAASNGADEAVRTLLKAGADFHEPRLLTAASYGCSPQILDLLIDLGLDVNEEGGEPLLNATAAGNFENMKFLIEHGANVNARGYKARTPLIMATRDDNDNFPADFKIVQLLLVHGAEVNAQDEDGWTPLMGAARDGDANIVRLLLDSKAESQVVDKQGNSPLSLATANRNSEIIQLLLRRETGDNVF